MANDGSTALQTRGAQEIEETEATRPGPLLTPAVDIFEKDGTITVLADMPGVKAEDLQIDLTEGILTLTGSVHRPEGEDEDSVAYEYAAGTFQRRFTLSEVIDQEKIEGQLTNGVLRLNLPKVQKAGPRQIEVRTA